MNLAWKLALVHKGLASPSLLATYTEERLPVIAEMLQQTTKLLNGTVAAKSGSQQDQIVWQRGGRLQQLGVNYRWSSIVVDERQPLAANFDRRPLDAYGSDDERVRAGDRAPEAPGLLVVKTSDTTECKTPAGELTSLFRILDPSKHTVLLFTNHAESMAPFLEALRPFSRDVIQTVLIFPVGSPASLAMDVELKIEVSLVDQEGHGYAGYSVSKEQPTVVIVRPDNIVGGIVTGLKALRHYLEGIFHLVA